MKSESGTSAPGARGAPVLEMDSVSRSFGPTRALDGVTLRLDAGAPVGLVGPNGAGKTTLFSIACGFLRPDRGDVRVLGHRGGAPAARGRVALLPQDAALRRRAPARAQLRLFARLQGYAPAAAAAEADRVLELTGTTALAGRAPERLSHGQHKRLLLAQALIGCCPLVLLDEPTAGLDPEAAASVREHVGAAAREQTFVISSHNLAEVEALCESVVLLEGGRVLAQRSMGELLGREGVLALHLEREAPAALLESMADLPGVTGVRSDGAKVVVELDPTRAPTIHTALLELLGAHGVGFLEISRGQGLERTVVDLLGRGESDPAQGPDR